MLQIHNYLLLQFLQCLDLIKQQHMLIELEILDVTKPYVNWATGFECYKILIDKYCTFFINILSPQHQSTSMPIGKPWQMVTVDILEVSISRHNNRYLLVMRDYMTSYKLQAELLKS